jgi:hypothetical protein
VAGRHPVLPFGFRLNAKNPTISDQPKVA